MSIPAPSKGLVAATASLAFAGLLSGCATNNTGGPSNLFKQVYANDDPCANNARNLGITLGVIGGGLAGHVLGGQGNKTTGAVVGAGLGALIGGLVGQDIDRRRCELSKIAKANNLELTVNDIELPTEVADGEAASSKRDEGKKIVGLSVSVADKGEQFPAGASRPSAQAINTFAEIAKTYRSDAGVNAAPEARQQAADRAKKMRILLVGHTDDTGSSQLNADLSEARAKAVAKVFADNGFSPDQIYYQGAGETLPIADNRTEAGRMKNRRVEIVDLSDEQTFAAFLASRKPNLSYYRPAQEVAANGSSAARDKGAAVPEHPTKRATSTKAAGVAVASSSQAKPKGSSVSSAPASQAIVGERSAPEAPASTNVVKTAAAQASESGVVAKTSATPPRTSTESASIDFGGTPMGAQHLVPDIGRTAPQASSFSLISTAQAADDSAPVSSCAQDRPRVKHGVKSLRNDQVAKFSTKDYLPGVYGTSWSDSVNGHLVALTNVNVLRDGGQPASRPDVMVYKNYVAGTNPKPDFSMPADANAYQGSKALLYRVFLSSGPLRCIDMVIPNKSADTAPKSVLVYLRDSKLYEAGFSPRIPH